MSSPVPNPSHRKARIYGQSTNVKAVAERTRRAEKAVAVLTAMVGLPPTVQAHELAESLGWSLDDLRPVLAAMERAAFVESWPDSVDRTQRRYMLSTKALARIGLSLAENGQRWNPDQPTIGPIRLRVARG